MNKKALIIAGTASMISQFNMINIEVLKNKNYDIDIACNFNNGNNIDDKEKERFKKELKDKGINYFQIDFTRNAFNIFGHIKAYKQIKKLKNKNSYALVHCHMPIVAFLTRLAFKKDKDKTRVLYTAHGFHFFKGAPILNWILYYPLEYIASYWTDTLITINHEDYNRSKNHFKAKNYYLTPSIGVDIDRFKNCNVNKEEILKELNIEEDKYILLSVGELTKKKNQEIIIKALHSLNNKNIVLLLIGIGGQREYLENLINKYNLQDNIKLLGYRKDVERICKVANCFVHIPTREGLGVAPLEAMASGLPLIASNINGINDYAKNEVTGYTVNPKSIVEVKEAIERMYLNKETDKFSKNNQEIVYRYSKENVKKLLEEIY